MIRYEYLDAFTIDTIVPLYEKMILENVSADARLKSYCNDKNNYKKLLSYSLNREDDLFLLIYEYNSLIGFIDSTRILKDEYEWYIKSVYFIPEYRNEDVFKKTIEYLEKIVKEKGIMIITNSALINDESANRIWRNCGYQIEGVVRKKVI